MIKQKRLKETIRAQKESKKRAQKRIADLANVAESPLQRAREIQRLSELGRELNSSLDIETVFQHLADAAQELSGATYTHVNAQLEPGGLYRRFVSTTHPESVPIVAWGAPRPGGLTELVLRTGEAVFVPDFQAEPRANPATRARGIRSTVALPIKAGGKTVGVLYAHSDKVNAYSQHDQELLAFLANQAGIAVQNARLYGEMQRLYELGGEVSSSLDVETVFQHLADAAQELSGATYARVNAQLEPGGVYRRFVSTTRPEGVPTTTWEAPRPGGMTEAVLRTGEPIFIPDLQAESRANPATRARGIRSTLALPIKAGGKTVGVLYANSDKVNAFGQHDQQLLMFLANQSGIAIQNARLFEETQRRASEMQRLAELGRELNSSLDIETVLQHLADAAQELSNATYVRVNAQVEAGGLLHRCISRIHPEGISDRPMEVPRPGGVSEAVFRTGQPVVISDSRTDPRVSPQALANGILSSMALPVKVGGNTIGALYANSDRVNAFSQHDLELLIFLADQAGVAVQNARLFGETRARTREMQRLSELGGELSSSLDIATVLQHLADAARELSNAVYVRVDAQVEPGEPYRRSISPIHPDNISVSPVAVLRPGGMSESIFQTGKPLVVPDLQAEPRANPHTLARGVRSQMILPIKVSGTTIGALYANSDKVNAFSQRDQELLTFLANQSGIAVQNGRLFEETRRRARELEQAYKTLELNQARLLLSEKMASLGRLTAGVAHEMNTPLAAVRSALVELTRLVTEYESSLGDASVTAENHREIAREMQQIVQLADTAAERAASFVRGMRTQTSGQAFQERQRFDAVAVIQDTLILLRHALKKTGCTVAIESPANKIELYGAPGRLSQVITNVVVNAIDASVSKGGGPITLRLIPGDKEVVLEIIDVGSGIAPEHLPKIFDPMFTTKPFGEGTGLGLTIVHDIVAGEFGGTIEVSSEFGQGTTFTIHFPLLPES